ncbi:MAG: hypothetical protein WB723_11365 [Candidatus Acidiferrales bacterium]
MTPKDLCIAPWITAAFLATVRLLAMGTLLIFAQTVSLAQTKSAKIPCKINAVDRAVYVTVLLSPAVWAQPVDADSIVEYSLVNEHNEWVGPLKPLGQTGQSLLSQASIETRDDFVAKSSKRCFLGKPSQKDLTRVEPANANDANAPAGKRPPVSREDYWSGRIELSRIGFNSQHSEAIVYLERVCGGLCGSGELLLLRFDAGSWKVTSRVNIWIS